MFTFDTHTPSAIWGSLESSAYMFFDHDHITWPFEAYGEYSILRPGGVCTNVVQSPVQTLFKSSPGAIWTSCDTSRRPWSQLLHCIGEVWLDTNQLESTEPGATSGSSSILLLLTNTIINTGLYFHRIHVFTITVSPHSIHDIPSFPYFVQLWLWSSDFNDDDVGQGRWRRNNTLWLTITNHS